MGKVVFVINHLSDVDQCAHLIEKLRVQGETVIALGLDFFTCRELYDKNIACKTPAEYLLIKDCRHIDELGAHFARNWYKSVNDRLTYRGISVGEMAEYDFTFLFLDALRSVEISKKVFDTESPDKIFIPARVPSMVPMHTCYETLPKTLNYMAGMNAVPVEYVPISRSAIFISRIKSMSAKARAILMIFKARFPFSKFSFASRNSIEGGKRILFLGVPFYSLIQKEMSATRTLAIEMPLLPITTRETKRHEQLIRNCWPQFKEDEELKGTLNYEDVPLLEILIGRFHHYFFKVFPQLIKYIEGANRVVEKVKPSMIVTKQDVTPLNRIAVKTARLWGLPALVIQHGIGTNPTPGLLAGMVESDKQAVWGHKAKENYVRAGWGPNSQIITGNPKFDMLVARRFNKEKMYTSLGLDSEKGIIVVIATGFGGSSVCSTPEPTISFVKEVLQALRVFPEKQVVIKLHPGLHQEYHKVFSAIADEVGIDVAITKDYLWELVDSCDVLVTSNSTVGLEAMILNKVVVNVNLEKPEPIPYSSSGAALGASEPDEIASAIKRGLYNEDVQKKLGEARRMFVYDHAYEQDGKASKRVADLIIQMIEEVKK